MRQRSARRPWEADTSSIGPRTAPPLPGAGPFLRGLSCPADLFINGNDGDVFNANNGFNGNNGDTPDSPVCRRRSSAMRSLGGQ